MPIFILFPGPSHHQQSLLSLLPSLSRFLIARKPDLASFPPPPRNAQDLVGVDAILSEDCISQLWPSEARQPGLFYPENKKSVLDGARVMFDTLVEDMGVSSS